MSQLVQDTSVGDSHMAKIRHMTPQHNAQGIQAEEI